MNTAFDQITVLLVDDEHFSRAVVSKMLRHMGFAEVVVALDGHQAIEILNSRPIHIVITDFRMPGIHGLDLLKRIRTGRTYAARNLPCAMLTSYAERHLVNLAIVLDVDSFLAKPVALSTMRKHLNRCFQYRFEPLEVELYEQVDVENAAPHLTGRRPPPPPSKDDGAQAESEEETGILQPPPGAADEVPAAATSPPPRPQARVSPPPIKVNTAPESAAPQAAVAPAPEKPKVMKKVPISEVPENAVIARDLVGTGGTLLLASGTPFKARYAKRLEELQGPKDKIEHIWILE
jgi:CheY-like chemotaxis protein